MNWTFLLFAFSLAVIVGAILSTLLARARPQWSPKRRLILSASVLPVVSLAATLALLAAILVSAEESEMKDLALAAVAAMGGISTIVAFGGGLVGAALRQRGMGR